MKLHLGCGHKILKGYINIDIKGKVDIIHDLNVTPYPFEPNSIDEVLMVHVLEHLGKDSETYFSIWKELYRICKHNAIIDITVPHPRSDNFINDPTHVRIVTPSGLLMFSKAFNNECIRNNYSNSTFGLDYDVDFEIVESKHNVNQNWKEMQFDPSFAIQHYNNVVDEYQIKLKVIKHD
jgi:hypothetical protein